MTDLISKHGGYKDLKSFQMSEIVFDLTYEFTSRFVNAHKQKDQMEGAARGGKQNISEGSQTSGTSKQSELRLVDVARSSLQELLEDYEDFLRIKSLPRWPKNDSRSLAIRKLAYVPNRSYKTYMSYMTEPESSANCLLCLINQANYLLDQQIRSLEKDLLQKGDFKERYKQARKEQIFGAKDDYDDFLKSVGKKRLDDGRVVSLED
jgi:restriction system protein